MTSPVLLLPRLCINCGGAEDDHPAGQCLFASTMFEPHRLSGDARAQGSRELWEPAVVDVVVTQEKDYWRGPMHRVFEAFQAGLSASSVTRQVLPAHLIEDLDDG